MDSPGVFLLGLLAVAGAMAALAYSAGLIGTTDRRVRQRVAQVAGPDVMSTAPTVRFQDNVTTGLSQYLVPASMREKLERTIVLAGRPDGWTVPRIVALKLAGLGVGVLAALSVIPGDPSLVNWVLGIAAMFAGYITPDVLITRRAQARQDSIQRELPDVLDQVTIAIESGLGFEAAFAHIAERRTSPLADEITRAVQDMRLGLTRKEAYLAMAERTSVEDLIRFVRAIVQAEQYGVSIASAVRNQSDEVRFARRKRAETEALKLPVKILFPLMLCILPVLFAVILTPAAIQIAKTVGGVT